MDLLLGYDHGHHSSSQGERLVCRLHKSIYGLKQASRQWYSKFSASLLQFGFAQSKSDYSFSLKGRVYTLLLFLYTSMTSLSPVLVLMSSMLSRAFFILNLNSRTFPSLELARSSKGIVFSQRRYTLQLLEDTGYLACKTK